MKPLVVITGPTACGKTPTAVALAKMIDGEIISADSMQIYKGMDIGTAKPAMAEREGIPHHMLDIANPHKDFSVAIFQQMAREAIEDIHNRGKIPILAGGTGFYITSTVYEDALTPEPEKEDIAIRQRLMDKAVQEGSNVLHERLKAIDPVSASNIHPNNVKRVIRALAYYEHTGQLFSSQGREKNLRYDTLFIILHRDRAKLYEAINRRVEMMIFQGLVSEVEQLLAAGARQDATAMQAIGYKEIIPHLNGQCTLEEAIAAIQQNSRRYAKRQLTWFRHQMDGHWLSMDENTTEEAATIIKYKAMIAFDDLVKTRKVTLE
ncbi:MAG: tRNA (adenosine(37)-N6)-dimethylallyltransferase MiaA [Defluviitaleaceae bacterium]|nr:tRNA (adenosine(37)-N6)-dimethylallyltransferase MiaA [Defluviitaleaceae bacterium]